MQIKKYIFILFLFFNGIIYSQEESNFVIEIIDGVEYYQHYVSSGETLYSLGLKYSTDEEIITRYNPHIKDGLKVDQKILIPVNGEEDFQQWTNPIKIENGFYFHKVKRKETLFGISKTYKSSVDIVTDNNPDIKNGLNIGMVLKIPVNDIDEITLPEDKSSITLEDKNKYLYHFVQQGETLYSLSIAYSVTTKQIEDINDGLPQGLKAGDKVKIKLKPTKTQIVFNTPENDTIKPDSKFDGMESGVMTIKHNTSINSELANFQKDDIEHLDKYGIAFMLPFYSNKIERENMKRSEALLQKISMNFYNGALLAMDTLKSYGLVTDIYTYELNRSITSLDSYFDSEEMNNTQLILGPLNRKQLFMAADASLKKGIHLVCPVPQSNKILLNHPNVSKTHPSAYSQISKMADYVITNHSKDNIIILNSLNLSDANLVNAFKKTFLELAENHPEVSQKSPKEHKATIKNMPNLINQLSKLKENVIIVPTKDKIVIQGLFTELSRIPQSQYKITVYGLEEWINYDFLDIDNLNKFNTSITCPTYIDYTNKSIKRFIKTYREKYNMEPDSYAFLGYDLMMYYGKGMLQFGANFPAYFEEFDQTGMLYTNIDFKQNGTQNGYENNHVFLLKFNNYTIVKKTF